MPNATYAAAVTAETRKLADALRVADADLAVALDEVVGWFGAGRRWVEADKLSAESSGKRSCAFACVASIAKEQAWIHR